MNYLKQIDGNRTKAFTQRCYTMVGRKDSLKAVILHIFVSETTGKYPNPFKNIIRLLHSIWTHPAEHHSGFAKKTKPRLTGLCRTSYVL